jgi:magnesium chelatase ATPase subunit I
MKTRKPVSPRNNRQSDQTSPGNLYPFSEIVGQDEMKLALVLNVIDPLIGGVLIMGHRGTGKSTAVRGLAEMLPAIRVVRDCRYRCDPRNAEQLCSECKTRLNEAGHLPSDLVAVRVVDLPLGATEDRVCGTVDIQKALQFGTKAFEPGLLASANRGFLYIDEVNLLDDHLVNLLLDAAATGRNRVEREGISVEHPSRFVLIGSGNPEEGELRPQLQDRFGFHVEITTDNNLDTRVSVVKKREAFERDPKAFCLAAQPQQYRLRGKIQQAKRNASKVRLDATMLQQIAQLCSALKIDGHRGELTIARAARALTAFAGGTRVGADAVKRVAVMSLRHRLRRDALEETASAERIKEALEQVFSASGGKKKPSSGNDGGETDQTQPTARDKEHAADDDTRAARAREKSAANPRGQKGSGDELRLTAPVNSTSSFPEMGLERTRSSNSSPSYNRAQRGSGFTLVNPERGHYRQAVQFKTKRIAIDATFRAAASRKRPFTITPDALRYKMFARKSGTLFIVAIDTSGSMALNRINQARATLLNLLKKSYVNRDRVAIVGFGGTEAKVLLPPSNSMLRARRVLDTLSIGGGTPLTAGLLRSLEIARRTTDESAKTILLLFTDGRANVSWRQSEDLSRMERRELIETEVGLLAGELHNADVKTIVIETQPAYISGGDAQRIAQLLSAQLIRLPLLHDKLSSQ